MAVNGIYFNGINNENVLITKTKLAVNGIYFNGINNDETLKDFLYSIDKPFNSPMYKVNYWLKQCGLKTIKF